MEALILTNVSLGLKAGLAAGVIYGAMVGILHLTTLEVCRTAQINFISSQLLKQAAPSNSSALDLFATDVVYYPMVYGIWALIYGVLFGVIFAYAYRRLPGIGSRRKGMALAIPVFFVSLFAGPASFFYQCDPSFYPIIPTVLGFPVSIAFGYVLGMFYDSFGRLLQEEKEEAAARRDSGLKA